MDITVVGPGAVGTLLGGLLSLRGHGVSFRCRQEQPGSVETRPLRIVLSDRWELAEGLHFGGPAGSLREPAAVLVALGRHHLRAVRRPDFARLLGLRKAADAEVVFVNADPAEPARLGMVQAGKAGRGWSLCLTLLDAVKLQDGEVELAGAGPTLVVEKGSAGHRLLSGLAGFGLTILPVADPLPCSDSLFVSQLLFLPVAMCNTTLARFLAFPEGRTLARSILGEGLEAMARAGRQLARLPVMDPQELLQRIEKKPDSFAAARTRPDRAYNTVLQSFLRGRQTEAPELNRKIVELASGAGLHLEWNWRVLQKVGRIASLGFYPGPGDLLRSLG